MNKVFIIVILLILLLLTSCNQEDAISQWESQLKEMIKVYSIGDIMSVDNFEGNIYASGRDGLYKFDGDEFSEQLEDLNLSYVRRILGDKHLWIASDDGLYVYNGKDVKIFTESNSNLLDDNTNSVYQDNLGRIWVGTWKGAVIFDEDLNIVNQQASEDGLLIDNVSVIHQSQDNKMWLGSYAVRNGGISYGEIGNWHHFTLKDGLSHENITSIISTEDKVYIGSGLLDRGGLDIFEFKDRKWNYTETISYESGLLAGQKVRSLFLDGNYLWVGSEYDGLSIINLENMNSVIVKKSLPHPEIKVIYYDKGSLWLGTLDGLAFLDEKTINLIYRQIE